MTIADAYIAACLAEIEAPKPGNVHIYAPGHGMTVEDFRTSALVSAPHIAASGATLGARILGAATATRTAVGQNTNLGIILACTPLAMAAERSQHTGETLRDAVRHALDAAGIADTAQIFAAIVLANPGGLGEAATHDVRQTATVPLVAAMREAAERDSIARLYATGFTELFAQALPAHRLAWNTSGNSRWAIVETYLRWMTRLPDSHVARRHGLACAIALQQEAGAMLASMQKAADLQAILPALLDWDRMLKRQNINPGTAADLTVATCFTDLLSKFLADRHG